jgi:DNA-binding NtrC family response regulator
MPSAEDIAVLVVEDDSIVRSWVRQCLGDSELRVAGEARSAQEPRARGRRRCHVLLVDQHLPDRLGTDLVRSLRRRGVDLPVVLDCERRQGLNETAREARRAGEHRQVLRPEAADRGDSRRPRR